MIMNGFAHIPVMLEECIEGLKLRNDGIYFDGTVGGGGHSFEILKRTAPNGRLIATDKDDDAIAAADERLKQFKGRYEIFKSDFKNYQSVLDKAEVNGLDGVILDFGVSSWQLDSADRGFSYMKADAPLDMRMDRGQALSAKDIVNEYSQSEITKILKIYGEEKFASNIALNIVKSRSQKTIETCGELSQIIESSIPAKFRQNGPAARKSFQAIRIAVNGELTGLYECVIGLVSKLKKGGRIVILTFHSLEDRIVKQAFRYLEQDCTCPKNLPVCVCGKKREIEILTKKPIIAGAKETIFNSRSKCAKLRIAEKIV